MGGRVSYFDPADVVESERPLDCRECGMTSDDVIVQWGGAYGYADCPECGAINELELPEPDLDAIAESLAEAREDDATGRDWTL